MSLQPNNLNKFPKHLQHVRIQKEEEEDLWISGEELCTEGSSDEENTRDVKKKNKSKATPSKEPLKGKKSSSSLTSSSKESDEEFSDRVDMQKSPTNWRPKRGSIKLPNIEETFYNYCSFPCIEDEKWETEYAYGKTLKQLKDCENQLKDFNFENEFVKIDSDNTSENENRFEHSEQILEMETEIDLLIKQLEICTQQRKEYEKDVCEELGRISKSTLELRSTQSFYDISKYKPKSESNLPSIKINKKKVKAIWRRKPKHTPRPQRKMTELNLCEEERSRLDYLLSDIDVTENDDNNEKNYCYHQQKEKELKLEDIINIDNAFNQTDDEKEKLNELHQKLKTLQECDDADLKGNASEQDIIDEENREWKALLKFKDDKFRRIDEKINKLLAEDKDQSTEKKDLMETLQET